MKEIIFGTTNPAKINQIQGALAPLGITVKGIEDMSALPVIEEVGTTAQQNARKKAITYAQALNQPVMAMDNALYFEELPDKEQPGVNVRRVGESGVALSDEELLKYYIGIVNRLGNRTRTFWEFAVCVSTPEGEVEEATFVRPQFFMNKPSENIIPGYPLDSLQVDTETNKYVSDMTEDEQARFWEKEIGKPLQNFFKRIVF